MKPDNLECEESEIDDNLRLKPLLEQLLVEARLPVNHVTTMLTYRLLFSPQQNFDGGLQSLHQRQQKRLLRFLTQKAFLSKLSELASTLFEPKFVHNRVMKPAMDRLEVVRKLQVGAKEPIRRRAKKVEEVDQLGEPKERATATPNKEDVNVEEKNEKKVTQKNVMKPRTTESQRKYKKIRESQV